MSPMPAGNDAEPATVRPTLTAVGDVTDQARRTLTGMKDQGAQAAGVVAERASAAKQQLADSDLPAPVRRPLPLAALGVAAAALIVVIVVVARRRRS